MDKNKLLEELKVLSGIENLSLEENELGLKLTVEGKDVILKFQDYSAFDELSAIGLEPEKEFAFAIFSNL